MAAKMLIVLAAIVAIANACVVPPGGCSPAACAALSAFDNIWTFNAARALWEAGKLGELFGGKSTAAGPLPGINLEIFTAVNVTAVVAGSLATTLSGCCDACRTTPGCVYYQFFQSVTAASALTGYSNLPAAEKTRCLLIGARAGKTYNGLSSPTAMFKQDQLNQKNNPSIPPSYVGGRCPANIKDDPHLTGGHGTPFDFNGKLDRPFCLTTDKNLQINVVLRGYEDTRTNGATIQANGKALRSWIKEVGFLWVAPDGTKHTMHMVARSGKQQERGNGFLAGIRVDGQDVAVPVVGETVTGAGGMGLNLAAVEKTGPFDVDVFSLEIAGVAEIELRMRVAHPALQSPDDAEAHFNLFLSDIKPTTAIHGVLGQTYRNTAERVQRSVKYSELASLLNAPVAADGETGKGFLDGSVDDYITPGVLDAGCKFSAFA